MSSEVQGRDRSADTGVGRPVWAPPRWAAPVTLLICILGIGVASYLTYAHYTDASNLACSDNGTIDCAKVTTSAQSRFLGMPVAVLGLAYFVVMAVACLPYFWKRPERFFRLGRLIAAAGGVAMILWLIYAELFIIEAICLYCSIVHVLTVILLVAVALATVMGSDGAGMADDFEDLDEYVDEEVEAEHERASGDRSQA